jgi:hypothetical protein
MGEYDGGERRAFASAAARLEGGGAERARRLFPDEERQTKRNRKKTKRP